MSQSDPQAMIALHCRYAAARAYLNKTKLRDVNFQWVVAELKACEEERAQLTTMKGLI